MQSLFTEKELLREIDNSKIRLHHIDCMEFMKDKPDNHWELAIVDPPYRDKNEPDQWLRANKGDMKKWRLSPNQDYFNELFRISKNQIIWGGNYFTKFLEPNNNWIIWHKLNEGVHFSMCEMAWNSIRKNIQLYKRLPVKSKIHPTEKPVQLYKWLLKNYAKPNDKILDTHGGSMSIAIACMQMGFELDLCEIDKDYFEAGKKRVQNTLTWKIK